MASTKSIAATLPVLALLSCGSPSDTLPALDRLPDRLVPGPGPATSLQLVLGQAPEHRGYRALFVRALDWERAEARLSNGDPSIAAITRVADASVDAANGRRATLSFSPVRPAAGYALTISLQRRDQSGSYRTVAAGSNADFAIAAGANAIAVTLAPTSEGELLVDVSKPSLASGALASEIATNSAFSVKRVAGDATGGNALGTSPTSASFFEISGLDVDASGTIYVADAGNHQIRRVPTSGATAVLAGSGAGAAGFLGDGAAAASALLDTPRGLTRDPATGAIYFCDAGNGRVRAIAPDGTITTLAGGGAEPGDALDDATDAGLATPFGLAADHDGNVFVTERGTGRVLRVGPDGAMTTLARLTPGVIGAIAIDRANALAWVGEGAAVRLVTGIDGESPALAPAPVFTASGTGAPYVTGLAFDQLGTLYAAQAGGNGEVDARIWRMSVTAAGLLQPGRAPEPIAGTGDAAPTAAAYSVPTVSQPNALIRRLAGKNWCALALDMSAAASPDTLSGLLYAGNSFDGAWGQVLLLTPSGL